MIFLDTSAAYALADLEDDFHSKAVAALESLLSDGDALFTHNYVLIETAALVQSRLGYDSALTFHRQTRDLVEIHWVVERDHSRAIDRWLERGTRQISLVDCMSFVIMEMYGATTAFAYDSDFRAEGFELVG